VTDPAVAAGHTSQTLSAPAFARDPASSKIASDGIGGTKFSSRIKRLTPAAPSRSTMENTQAATDRQYPNLPMIHRGGTLDQADCCLRRLSSPAGLGSDGLAHHRRVGHRRFRGVDGDLHRPGGSSRPGAGVSRRECLARRNRCRRLLLIDVDATPVTVHSAK
jgi:hypothetical protein